MVEGHLGQGVKGKRPMNWREDVRPTFKEDVL